MAEPAANPQSIRAPFGRETVMRLIPHREPFLLIDRVEELEPGVSIRATRRLTEDDPWFAGHFPDHPLMPGVLMVEAIAQAGAVMALSVPELANKLAVLGGVNKCRIRRMVTPGDQMEIEAKTLYMRMGAGKISGRVLVGGKVAAEATISFMLMDQESD